MKSNRFTTLPFLMTLALALGALPAGADDATGPTDSRNELVVFGGVSLLDASRSNQTTIDVGNIDLPGIPGIPGIPGFGGRFGRAPIAFPPVTFETETSLGSSALFGARYSRLIKHRLALEVDLTIAPGHALESRFGACVEGTCTGGGRGENSRFDQGLGERNVTAWHYGAGLAYELTGGDVRPLLILGAGGVTWDGARADGTDFVFRFGAGLKILFGRVGVRVDVVDHLVLDHFASDETEHDVHATAGLLVRF